MNSEGKTTVFPGPEDDRFPWASQVAVSVAVLVVVAVAVSVAVSSNVVRPKKGAERTTSQCQCSYKTLSSKKIA